MLCTFPHRVQVRAQQEGEEKLCLQLACHHELLGHHTTALPLLQM